MFRVLLRLSVALAYGCRTPVCEESTEIPYDDVDQDCDGADLTDMDGDGYDAVEVGGGDCDDQDPSVNPGATEVWYDGGDQDCDGASDFDMDADGYDDAAHGGTDCDDGDPTAFPSASESPYDGVDQDCDGADLTDVDCDGYDAAEVGGDDCDDAEPAIYPGVCEVVGDGVDQDCDGRTDEYLACADGTGDFTTVQDGIDGVPDGAILELCPGTYEEDLDVSGREVDIEGGGEEPDDVVLRGVSASYHIVTSTGTDARFYWLSMESNGSGTQNGVLVDDASAFEVDTVNLCSPTAGYLGFMGGSCGTGDEITILRSYFCSDPSIEDSYGGVSIRGGCTFTFSRNTVVPTATGTTWTLGFGISRGTVNITNNLFIGGSIYFGSDAEDAGAGAAVFHVGHNTFADLPLLLFSILFRDGCSSDWPYDFRFTNNIFANVATYDSIGVWYAYIESYHAEGFAELLAPDFSSNLLWSVTTPYATISETVLACSEYDENYGDATIVSEMMASASILADPLFTTEPSVGSYALDPASPAVDAGEGEPDPDGTPPDLGAFGGPEGAWWQEVPWPLP